MVIKYELKKFILLVQINESAGLFSFLVDPATGLMVAELPNDVIPSDILQQIDNISNTQGVDFEAAVAVVRRELLSPDYEPFPYRSGRDETHLDKMRSIIANYKLRAVIEELKTEGVDFSTYLYVPEIDPISHDTIHERGDHNHI